MYAACTDSTKLWREFRSEARSIESQLAPRVVRFQPDQFETDEELSGVRLESVE